MLFVLQEAIGITNGNTVVVYEVSGDIIRAAGKYVCSLTTTNY